MKRSILANGADNGLEGEALEYRRRHHGLIGVESKVPIKDRATLSLVYTPGVAEPCMEIFRDAKNSFEHTCRGNTVALITDGSAIFGLGRVGPEAALPAMEGKSVIFKTFAGIELTAKGNLVAVVSDGSAVLGLGNIGARAAMPVMEGKAVLFRTFGGVEAFPVCIATQEQDEIVEVTKAIAPVFGGVNLEDISAPRCFYIEERRND